MNKKIDENELNKISGGTPIEPNSGPEPRPETNCDNCFSKKCKHCLDFKYKYQNFYSIHCVVISCGKNKFQEDAILSEKYHEIMN